MKLSISVASGQALVGNAGSDQRLKYGPRGTTVHLASRLESASKKLDIAILVCDQTRQQLRDASLTREIGTFALPGISEPQLVHELIVDDVIKQPGSNGALERPKESQELTPGFS